MHVAVHFDRAINPHEPHWWDAGNWREKCREALDQVTGIATRQGWILVVPGHHDVTVESYEYRGDPAIAFYEDWQPGIRPAQAIVTFVPDTSNEHVERTMISAMQAVEGYLLLHLSEQRIDLTGRQLRLLDVRTDKTLRFPDIADGLLELIHVRESRNLSSLHALREFEELISDTVPERDLQDFFEAWPEFLTPLQLLDARPHVVLESSNLLIPDFAIQVAGQSLYDLLELKRPTERLVVGGIGRPQLARAAARGLNQLRQYREALEEPAVHRRVLDRYGIDLFRPRLHLVIGRYEEADARVLRRSLGNELGPGEAIYTYDQLLDAARARLGLPPRWK